MVWWGTLSGGLALLLGAFMTGAPIFIAFLVINIAGVLIVLGQPGFGMVANSIFETTNIAALSAVPLFILMGELLFRSGSIDILFDSVDKLVGKVRGRQYVLCIVLSTIFGALSGAAMGVAAMMARTLYPGMIERKYDSRLSTGAILAGASLAPIIPPSVLVIIIGTLADVSIAGLLIAGIVPGLLLSSMFLIYIFARVRANPELAPYGVSDTAPEVTTWEMVVAVLRVLPFAIIIFCVMGFILLGIATPSESAATGVLGALLTAVYYRKLNWQMISESVTSAAFITSMILVIMASSKMFSQLLAFTGSTRELTTLIVTLNFEPYVMLFIMMLIPFILCMFIDQIALMLVVIPIYQPLLGTLGFDPIWFWLIMLLNVTVGGITPPFGYTMFAFKGSAPHVPLKDIFNATWPFVGIFLVGMIVIAAFPPLATWLPGLL
ncbi:MAG: TRAP transporter large permease [Defluviicoccus sp.]|nr:TRAP transporter large permease [Defluviicoccus sp.]MDE0274713.1 TRAP transporter large permease [Defluviicoccus sp.]